MEKEITEVYCGNGRGKTTLAIGQALKEIAGTNYYSKMAYLLDGGFFPDLAGVPVHHRQYDFR